MKSLFLPKYEWKIVRISALCSEGRNLDNFLWRNNDFINSFWNCLTFSSSPRTTQSFLKNSVCTEEGAQETINTKSDYLTRFSSSFTTTIRSSRFSLLCFAHSTHTTTDSVRGLLLAKRSIASFSLLRRTGFCHRLSHFDFLLRLKAATGVCGSAHCAAPAAALHYWGWGRDRDRRSSQWSQMLITRQ